MSKSILQEVATFNAEQFNATKLKADIQTHKEDIQEFYNDTIIITDNNLNKYKIQNIAVSKIINDINETLKSRMIQLEIGNLAFENFIIDEISANYKTIGIVKKEYRRKIRINEELIIKHLPLSRLEDFTGPIKEITEDEGFFDYYGPTIADSARSWIWIQDRNISYRDWNIIKANVEDDTIIIGCSKYNIVDFPGFVNIENNLTITDGTVDITSPVDEVISITVNKNILSTDGNLAVSTGISTTTGNISTGTGNISTTDGNISSTGTISTDGDISTTAGSVTCSTGVTTTTGGYSCGISGDFITASGVLNVTGEIKSTQGDIYTEYGDIYSTEGNITDIGTITTRGNILIDSDGLTINGGNVVATTSDASFKNLNVTGTTTFSDITTGNITCDNVTCTEVDCSGDGNFTGDVNVKKITTTGAEVSEIKNLKVSTKLDVTTSTTAEFNCDIDAGGKTITAETFEGTATKVKYADVAEKYLSDKYYECGTVLSIGGDKEVTLFDPNLPLAGLVSTNPGYLLNSELSDGVDIALVGRVPAKTRGVIYKSQYIFPDYSNPGYVIGVDKVDKILYDVDELIGISISDSKDNIVEVKV